MLVNSINNMLGNYDQTRLISRLSNNMRKGDESEVISLMYEMEQGNVDAVLIHGCNPAFDLPFGHTFAEALANVDLSVSFAHMEDETTAVCKYIAPPHHLLEAWGDVEPKSGHLSLIQPTISPLFETRQAEESLLTWAESANLDTSSDQPYYEYLKAAWRENYYPTSGIGDFQTFWDKCLHDGVYNTPHVVTSVAFAADVASFASKVSSVGGSGMEVTFYEQVSIGAGAYANNPWLLEMPDPITRTSWGNYLAVPLEWDGVNSFNGLNGLEDADLADLNDR